MSACPGLWAVVINWNGGSLNLDCLASLVSCGLPPERIVFVDNASDDGSLEGVRAAHGGLVILENESNLGFGAAANQGAAAALEAGAELVVYVNNDLTFEEGCLAALMEYLAERPAVGVVGPRILSAIEPERVWCAGGRLDYRQNLSTLQGFGELDGPAYRGSGPVDYVPGCALMIRREALQTLGGFDAGYFAYMEDVDLCVCARAAVAAGLGGPAGRWACGASRGPCRGLAPELVVHRRRLQPAAQVHDGGQLRASFAQARGPPGLGQFYSARHPEPALAALGRPFPRARLGRLGQGPGNPGRPAR